VHSLRTTADTTWLKSFKPKEAICPALSSLGGEKHMFLNADQIQTLEILHQNLPYDHRAQIYIDTYLPCSFLADGALREKHKTLTSSHLVFHVADAPQFGNLPDVGYVIRQSILRSWSLHEYQNNPKAARTNPRKTDPQSGDPPLPERSRAKETARAPFLAECVMHCFPSCQRGFSQNGHRPLQDHAAAETRIDTASIFVVLNILLGTLLGLHPASNWRPGFATRCNLYKRIHRLLTSDEHTMTTFIRSNRTLIQLAVIEYVCSVVPIYMPAEAEFWTEQVLPEDFLKQCTVAFDAFRRNVIDDGLEKWKLYNTNAASAVDLYFKLLSCGRLKGGLHKQPTPNQSAGGGTLVRRGEDVAWVLDQTFGTNVWDAEPALTKASSRDSHGLTVEQIASVLRLAQFSRLPENLIRLQRGALETVERRCEYRAWCRRTKHVCFFCLMKGVDTAFRVDSETSRVICNNGCDNCTVGVNMIGTILTLKQKRYVFAPCCAKVVEYDESHCASMWTGTCQHASKARPLEPSAKRQARYRCAHCQSPSKTLVPYSFPSLRRVCMVSTYLCRKHTPGGVLLKYVYNQEDFEEVCNEWASQHRPWYRRTRHKVDAGKVIY